MMVPTWIVCVLDKDKGRLATSTSLSVYDLHRTLYMYTLHQKSMRYIYKYNMLLMKVWLSVCKSVQYVHVYVCV